MGAGALDAVNTPILGEPSPQGGVDGGRPLLAKIETIRKLIGPTSGRKSASPAVPSLSPSRTAGLVAIGASAGGPAAVSKILAALPADFPAAIVVVQHVDPQFAHGLTDWLRSHTQLRVRLVEEGDRPQAGTVFLAGREHHLVLASPTHLGYTRHPVESSYHPSVDVFFKSVSRQWRGLAVGVLLTGMGRDGAAGLKALRDQGCHTIAQDQATSAVYGMPKAAVELDAATEILALDKIAPRLTNMFQCEMQHAKSKMPPASS
jgi:two-component system, chemotaxis family, response regulator WspF